MDLAEELAARDMSVTIHIGATQAHIALYRCGTHHLGSTKIRQGPAMFDLIEAEIERLLEGCDEETD